ncbi:TetR/AcrR family transcriptional regulator [Streptomyces sp. NPDC050842]|uniref:TetR/AcrR family transcriptional regulator n=1 Tax=Streptomyces sp. NPDC050842 TaxID=3365636 RepID=UPI0037B701F1
MEGAARVIARNGVRGLRMEELATEAGVSIALIYYHFKDRAGVLRHTLEFISDRADRYLFEPELRGDLARATLAWIHDVADLLSCVRPTAPAPALTASAERLTGLLEGLSTRWLSGALPLPHARELVREAVSIEVERLSH